MGASLVGKERVNIIRMRDLKNGQIAELMEERYAGIIIQRYFDNAVPIGLSGGNGWSAMQENTLRVRLLEEDELIRIFNNK
jgi:hypothetical protein